MKRLVIVALLIILNSVLVLGTFGLNSDSIQQNYQGGEIMKGSIKLNLTNEISHQLITSNFIGNVSLIDLIRRSGGSEGIDYKCSTPGCLIDYSDSDSTINSLSISSNRKIFGFKLNQIDEINDIRFNITSSSAPSCTSQVSIDVLGLNEINIDNTRYNSEVCGDIKRGCYNSNAPVREVQITADGVCEKISLSSAPAYKFGARIKNTSEGSSVLEMRLFDEDLLELGKCALPDLAQTIDDISCIINYPITNQESFYVCVSATGSGVYKTFAEESSPLCGNAATQLGEEFSFDYDIHAQALKYDSVNINMKDAFEKISDKTLAQYADDYLFQKYAGNCSKGCYIPFVVRGEGSQTISFSNVNLLYNYRDNILSDSNLYELESSDSLVSAADVNLVLDLVNFSVPLINSTRNFDLYLGSRKILSRAVNITPGFEFDIIPKFSLLAVPTKFNILSRENITSSSWNFGDNSVFESNGTSASHIYREVGNYTLTVSAKTSRGYQKTKSFTVYSGNVSESLQELIKISKARIQSINSFIQPQPLWIKQEISSKLNISEMQATLNRIEQNSSQTSGNVSKISMIESILALKIPEYVKVEKSGTLPLALGYNSIDISIMQKISNKEVPANAQNDFRDDLLYWIHQNYNSAVDFQTIYKRNSGEGIEPIITHMRIRLEKKNNINNETFFIINYPKDQIIFMQNYNPQEIKEESKSATYLPITNLNEIQFIVPGEVDFANLGMYPSPSVSSLGKYGSSRYIVPELPIKWLIFWIAILIIAILVIYIALQEWYKKRYETYLFRNSDDLYNVINFIHNSRNSGLSEQEMKKKLSAQGWSGEQLIYAIRKFEGKRTGMFEIPLFRAFEQKKIKEEIAKRQAGDARFIKRPGYSV